jgi:AraC family transcriptional regulator
MANAAGGRLAVEALAHVMAVHLIRNVVAPRRPGGSTDGALGRRKLGAVIDYIEEHLDASLTLKQMATAIHLSPYHFARQFKAATGVPPHQYVMSRRVERARQLLRECDDLSVAEVSAVAGFSDQSHFSHNFKRALGVTPRQFRRSARTE